MSRAWNAVTNVILFLVFAYFCVVPLILLIHLGLDKLGVMRPIVRERGERMQTTDEDLSLFIDTYQEIGWIFPEAVERAEALCEAFDNFSNVPQNDSESGV